MVVAEDALPAQSDVPLVPEEGALLAKNSLEQRLALVFMAALGRSRRLLVTELLLLFTFDFLFLIVEVAAIDEGILTEEREAIITVDCVSGGTAHRTSIWTLHGALRPDQRTSIVSLGEAVRDFEPIEVCPRCFDSSHRFLSGVVGNGTAPESVPLDSTEVCMVLEVIEV